MKLDILAIIKVLISAGLLAYTNLHGLVPGLPDIPGQIQMLLTILGLGGFAHTAISPPVIQDIPNSKIIQTGAIRNPPRDDK
jgi:hypothetical protein